MANVTIDALSAATSINDADVQETSQSSFSKKTTRALEKTYFQTGLAPTTDPRFPTTNEKAAMDAATTPSGTNAFATIADKASFIAGLALTTDPRFPTTNEKAALDGAPNPITGANPVGDMQSVTAAQAAAESYADSYFLPKTGSTLGYVAIANSSGTVAMVNGIVAGSNISISTDVSSGAKTISATSSGFIYKGQINVAADFPTTIAVQSGWLYNIGTNVTDNDATKTNTGLSFLAGQNIAWSGSTWNIVSATQTYTTTTPTNITVGGIISGTSFTNAPYQDVFDQLLHTYLAPAFTTFALDQTAPLEVGQTISGAHTFTWSTSNSSNVTPNSIIILDVTGSHTLASGHANNGTFAYDFTSGFGNVTLILPGSYDWRVLGVDTHSNTFNLDLALSWMWKRYWGDSALTSLTSAQVLALTSNSLSTTTVGSFAYLAGGYKYFCVPASWTQPVSFKDHATGFGIDMQAPVSLSVTNAQGIATSYNIYRSTYVLTSSLTIDVA